MGQNVAGAYQKKGEKIDRPRKRPDSWQGTFGLPFTFVEDFENCKRYGSEELVKEFLKGKYATEQFKDKFIGATVRKIIMLIE